MQKSWREQLKNKMATYQVINQISGLAGAGGAGGGGAGRRGGSRGVSRLTPTGVGGSVGGGVPNPQVMGRQMGRYFKNVKQGQKGMELGQARFNFELLSTMFLGMQISAIFGGMVKQVTGLMGFGEIFKALLISLLAPVLKPILDIFIKIVKFVMALPKPIKTLIGAMIIGVALAGTILFFGSQILLGLSGMLAAGIGLLGVGAAITGAASTLAGIVGSIVTVMGVLLMIGSAVIGLFVAMASWALTLEDSLRRTLMLISSIGAAIPFVGSSFGLVQGAMQAGGGITNNINVTQNNTGGITPVQSNRDMGALERIARSVLATRGIT